MRGYDEAELDTVRRFLHDIIDAVVAQRGAHTGSVAPGAPPRHAVHEPRAEQPREPRTRPHYRGLKD
jgi:hypothetical protein